MDYSCILRRLGETENESEISKEKLLVMQSIFTLKNIDHAAWV